MKTIETIPVFEVEFTNKGKLFDSGQLDTLANHLRAGQVTDLILFAHGWNNNVADARDLATRLFTEIGKASQTNPPAGIAGRRFAGACILWPSMKFEDKDLIPGGGVAALGSKELSTIRARLAELGKEPVRLGKTMPVNAVKKRKLARASALLKNIDTDTKAQQEFVGIIRSMLSEKAAHADDGTKEFFKLKESQLLSNLRDEAQAPMPQIGRGGAAGGLGNLDDPETAGGAAGFLGDMGDSVLSGVRRLMNFTTYYQMKERAGLVGSTGAADMLAKLRRQFPALRLHLIGHSFGGRLVTAAADSGTKITSLTLLQAAFSHNGFAAKFDDKKKLDGFFRKIVAHKKVQGPILVTHTKADRAVGIAYPLASRVARQNAAVLGDANDPYGGIGRNGAARTDVATNGTLQLPGAPYKFTSDSIFNLNADGVIGDHSDICKPHVGWAFLSAVATTGTLSA
jgi:hypothetical protein